MIEQAVKNWEATKHLIRLALEEKHPADYKELVQLVIKHIGTDDNGRDMNHEGIHVIDDGDYQGSLLFIIPELGYQPDTYWVVKVGYGSCSGCDTLEGIRDFDFENKKPDVGQVDAYMTLALHIVQGLKEV